MARRRSVLFKIQFNLKEKLEKEWWREGKEGRTNEWKGRTSRHAGLLKCELHVCVYEKCAHVRHSQWWAVETMTQVTVRRGPPPRLSVATDGYAMVFRRLRSPSLSDAHTDTLTHACTCTHILCPWWDTISTLQHSLFLCLPPAQTHTHSRQPPSPPPQVCVCACICVCAAIISNHVSVFSLAVCELPPPGRPICVVAAVMVMASKSSLLPAASPPMMSPFAHWGQTGTPFLLFWKTYFY